MKDIDYEEILNYISLILALIILIIILYRYFFNSHIENFEVEKIKAEGKAIVSGISEIKIEKKGTGYIKGKTTVKIAEPSTDGIKAEAEVTINDNGEIEKILVTKNGKGYDPKNPPVIEIIGAGNDSKVIAIVGAVSEITITNPGKGYTYAPTINFGTKPSGENAIIASATTEIDTVSGEVKKAVIQTAGIGYNQDFDITFQTPQEAEEASNPYIKIEAEKKTELLELLDECNALKDELKQRFINAVKDDKLRKKDVEEIMPILEQNPISVK